MLLRTAKRILKENKAGGQTQLYLTFMLKETNLFNRNLLSPVAETMNVLVTPKFLSFL